jgi:spore coat polysaccharide biosynthesis protein SpsF
MSVTCVVQARMRSSRLPGKVLAEVGGEPMLAVLLRRLAPLQPDHLVVATTGDPADDAIEDLAGDEGVDVVRGPEEDVLARFGHALERFPADVVVRITADCPLVDADLVRSALELRSATRADYVSNTLVRTYPDGLDVEVLTAAALRAADAEAVDPVEREHVTPFVYRRPERFALRALRASANLGHLRWTVDTPEDLDRVRGIFQLMGRTSFDWHKALPIDVPPQTADGRSFLPEAAENEPASRIWIAREGGQPLGQTRVDVRDGVGRVSIAVEASHSQEAVGRWMLDQLQAALGADEQVHTLTVQVHRGDLASAVLFREAGFVESGEDGELTTMRWVRPGRSAPG